MKRIKPGILYDENNDMALTDFIKSCSKKELCQLVSQGIDCNDKDFLKLLKDELKTRK